MKITTLRTLFHTQLAHLYDVREIDALFFTYIEEKYAIAKHHFFLNPNDDIEYAEEDLNALRKATPIQYILKKTFFYNLELDLNPAVLIPRPETEELVAMILKNLTLLRSSALTVSKILDIGTGSGAIAIALAKNMENVEIWATDVSEEALKTAKKNAMKCKVNIHFLHHDILTDDISFLPDNLDIIVSNPPYIPRSEQKKMPQNVVNYEPETALFVPDENPLLFYHAIAERAKKILRKGGALYFETHEEFQFEIAALLAELDFQEIQCGNDINGKPRFVCCKKL